MTRPAPAHDNGLVLCYHAVSETWESPLAVTPAQLERQVRGFLDRGYAPMTFAAAVDSSAPRRLVVTFDDAYASVLRLARPVLDRLGVPATVYVVTDAMQSPGTVDWGPGVQRWLGTTDEGELEIMTWADVAVLGQAGWEIGSHTCSHPHLPTLTPGEVDAELCESRALIEERVGLECATLAYPFGDVTSGVSRAAAAAGYQAAAAIRVRPPDRYAWPRVDLFRHDGDLLVRAKTSRAGRWLHARAPGTPRLR